MNIYSGFCFSFNFSQYVQVGYAHSHGVTFEIGHDSVHRFIWFANLYSL